ncbi:MAG: phosphonate metabolism protein/1,5-bisphosphokinase (PRPP-forming) PhnN [Alphaproteobacteria bacterium PA2]|nr:MAG: phosphonate metabolism protein/1,5-bisphosphokinase (PRPP-forming) PhnN [Alphaproteobacteria bacterium PA2]
MPEGGRLVLVVGPSGVGKDTLIEAAKNLRLSGVRIVKRDITRSAELGGEDYASISEADFARRESAGRYALSWRAHGLSYGIPGDILEDLAAGQTVVANVSRTVLMEARQRYRNLVVVSVTASPETIRARLTARGRETDAEIEGRISRAAVFVVDGEDVIELCNDGSRAEAVAAFVALL